MSAPLEPGSIICGKYRVEQVLGEGGMGVVVSALHLKLEQRVAIKFLRPAMLEAPEVVERFVREARAASRIQGDHVVRVMDVDTLEDGAPFLVMEHLEGADLSSVRSQQAPLPPGQAVDYVLQAAEAIAEAHSLGIIHRDLKPANLFLAQRRDGIVRVKVLDFGISKLMTHPGSDEIGITGAAMVMGSPEYMSPEQMLSTRDVDVRTDVWALGVILYELCTAEVPFPGTTFAQICALVMSTPPPSPREVRPQIPEGLEAIILRCLQKDPALRFQSVAELQNALSPFRAAAENKPGSSPVLSSKLVLGETLPAAPERAQVVTVSAVSSPYTLLKPARSKRTAALATSAILLFAATTAALAFGLRDRAAPASPPAAGAGSMASMAPTAPIPPAAPTISVLPAVPRVEASASTTASNRPSTPRLDSPRLTPSAKPTHRPIAPLPTSGID